MDQYKGHDFSTLEPEISTFTPIIERLKNGPKIMPKIKPKILPKIKRKPLPKISPKMRPMIEPNIMSKSDPKFGRKTMPNIKLKFDPKPKSMIEPNMKQMIVPKNKPKIDPKIKSKVMPKFRAKIPMEKSLLKFPEKFNMFKSNYFGGGSENGMTFQEKMASLEKMIDKHEVLGTNLEHGFLFGKENHWTNFNMSGISPTKSDTTERFIISKTGPEFSLEKGPVNNQTLLRRSGTYSFKTVNFRTILKKWRKTTNEKKFIKIIKKLSLPQIIYIMRDTEKLIKKNPPPKPDALKILQKKLKVITNILESIDSGIIEWPETGQNRVSHKKHQHLKNRSTNGDKGMPSKDKNERKKKEQISTTEDNLPGKFSKKIVEQGLLGGKRRKSDTVRSLATTTEKGLSFKKPTRGSNHITTELSPKTIGKIEVKSGPKISIKKDSVKPQTHIRRSESHSFKLEPIMKKWRKTTDEQVLAKIIKNLTKPQIIAIKKDTEQLMKKNPAPKSDAMKILRKKIKVIITVLKSIEFINNKEPETDQNRLSDEKQLNPIAKTTKVNKRMPKEILATNGLILTTEENLPAQLNKKLVKQDLLGLKPKLIENKAVITFTPKPITINRVNKVNHPVKQKKTDDKNKPILETKQRTATTTVKSSIKYKRNEQIIPLKKTGNLPEQFNQKTFAQGLLGQNRRKASPGKDSGTPSKQRTPYKNSNHGTNIGASEISPMKSEHTGRTIVSKNVPRIAIRNGPVNHQTQIRKSKSGGIEPTKPDEKKFIKIIKNVTRPQIGITKSVAQEQIKQDRSPTSGARNIRQKNMKDIPNVLNSNGNRNIEEHETVVDVKGMSPQEKRKFKIRDQITTTERYSPVLSNSIITNQDLLGLKRRISTSKPTTASALNKQDLLPRHKKNGEKNKPIVGNQPKTSTTTVKIQAEYDEVEMNKPIPRSMKIDNVPGSKKNKENEGVLGEKRRESDKGKHLATTMKPGISFRKAKHRSDYISTEKSPINLKTTKITSDSKTKSKISNREGPVNRQKHMRSSVTNDKKSDSFEPILKKWRKTTDEHRVVKIIRNLTRPQIIAIKKDTEKLIKQFPPPKPDVMKILRKKIKIIVNVLKTIEIRTNGESESEQNRFSDKKQPYPRVKSTNGDTGMSTVEKNKQVKKEQVITTKDDLPDLLNKKKVKQQILLGKPIKSEVKNKIITRRTSTPKPLTIRKTIRELFTEKRKMDGKNKPVIRIVPRATTTIKSTVKYDGIDAGIVEKPIAKPIPNIPNKKTKTSLIIKALTQNENNCDKNKHSIDSALETLESRDDNDKEYDEEYNWQNSIEDLNEQEPCPHAHDNNEPNIFFSMIDDPVIIIDPDCSVNGICDYQYLNNIDLNEMPIILNIP